MQVKVCDNPWYSQGSHVACMGSPDLDTLAIVGPANRHTQHDSWPDLLILPYQVVKIIGIL